MDCPKDPNFRSTHDLAEELQRITDMHQLKKKTEEQPENTQALDLLIERTGNEVFNRQVSESFTSSDDSYTPQPSDPSEFNDILKIKRGMTFDPSRNLLQVEDYMGKERKGARKKSEAPRVDKPAVLRTGDALEYLDEAARIARDSTQPT